MGMLRTFEILVELQYPPSLPVEKKHFTHSLRECQQICKKYLKCIKQQVLNLISHELFGPISPRCDRGECMD